MTTVDEARAAHRFDHDGMWRHHHADPRYWHGEAVWWENVEQFGGEKVEHTHDRLTTEEARAALLVALRVYGEATAVVANGKATRVRIDHAWGVLRTREVALEAAIRAESEATIRHLEERLAEYMLENAALRAEAGTLDVDRLTTAMDNVMDEYERNPGFRGMHVQAAAVAAEYARLAGAER